MISGMRASCEIVVRVDIAAAIAAGMVRAYPKREREWGHESGSERDRNRERRVSVLGPTDASTPLPPVSTPPHPPTHRYSTSLPTAYCSPKALTA